MKGFTRAIFKRFSLRSTYTHYLVITRQKASILKKLRLFNWLKSLHSPLDQCLNLSLYFCKFQTFPTKPYQKTYQFLSELKPRSEKNPLKLFRSPTLLQFFAASWAARRHRCVFFLTLLLCGLNFYRAKARRTIKLLAKRLINTQFGEAETCGS